MRSITSRLADIVQGRAARYFAMIPLLISCHDGTAPVTAHTASLAAVGSTTPTGVVGASVTVSVRASSNGVGVEGLAVTFVVSAGGGSVTPASTSTDQSGQASVVWTLGTAAGLGTNALTASSGTLAPVSFSANAVADKPDSIAPLAGTNQHGYLGLLVPVPPSVVLTDRFGNPVAGAAVTFTIASGAGTVSGAAQTTNSAGDATLPGWQLGGSATTQSVSAAVSGLRPVMFVASATPAPLPTNAEWALLASQFGMIGADAFGRAAAPILAAARLAAANRSVQLSTSARRLMASQVAGPSTFSGTYKCCTPASYWLQNVVTPITAPAYNPVFGPFAYVSNVSSVQVAGTITPSLDLTGTGTLNVSEIITEGFADPSIACVSHCDLPFTAGNVFSLPPEGLNYETVVNVKNGVVVGEQIAVLTVVSKFYSVPGIDIAWTANLSMQYTVFPNPPASATGTFGSLSGTSVLPLVAAPNSDHSVYPVISASSGIGTPFTGVYAPDSIIIPKKYYHGLSCPAPTMTATGGAMANVFVSGQFVFLAQPALIYPGSENYPDGQGGHVPMQLASGGSIQLGTGFEPAVPPPALAPPVAFVDEDPVGPRYPWNAVFQVSYTDKSAGIGATYSFYYACH